jgi:integrase/recombinase XerD
MLVQRVLVPGSGVESRTVLGNDHAPVEPVERSLANLTAAERSPNTVKGYAHDVNGPGALALARPKAIPPSQQI